MGKKIDPNKATQVYVDWVADIFNMHQKFGHHTAVDKMNSDTFALWLEFRKKFLEEEHAEMLGATTAEDFVDALIDYMVVAIGTLDMADVDARLAWYKVHCANMSKECGINSTRPNPLGLPDLIKPPRFVPPDHTGNVGRLAEVFDDE